MRLEVRIAELSPQAIMRGRKQMPLKVVPISVSTSTFVFFNRLTLLVQISKSAFRICLHNALGFSMAGAVGGQSFAQTQIVC
jgi:hypothetical protein